MSEDNGEVNSEITPERNIEAEMAFLGSCLLDNDVIRECIALVFPIDFSRSEHGKIWDAIQFLFEQDQPVDAVSLADELIRRDQFEAIGGDDALREIVDSVPHAANGRYYAGIVIQKSIARGDRQKWEAAAGVRVAVLAARKRGQECSWDLGWDGDLIYQLMAMDELVKRGLIEPKVRIIVWPKKVDYRQYIDSAEWREKSETAKERAGWRCQVCNASRNDAILDTHHRTYDRLGSELDSDLIVLCRSCHTLFHENGRLAR